MSVKMWSVMPKDYETNGLTVIEKLLADSPDTEHVIIARVNRKRFTGDDDTHETTQLARVVHVEVVSDPSEQTAALELLLRAYKRRTGADQLPFPSKDED